MSSATKIARRLAAASAFLTLPLLAAAPAPAQGPAPDARWQAWLGCWEPVAAPAADAGAAPGKPMLCVVPAHGGAGVEVATVAEGTIVEREPIAPTGERRPLQQEGCAGWEQVEWSRDGRRAYRRSEHQCAGGVQRRSTAVLSILPSGEWLHVHGVSAGGNSSGVRVLRYRAVTSPDELPAEVARALEGRALALETARMAAAARLSTEDVIEATRHLDPEVVEAWLIEREQGFAVDARQLVELAEAGVPERVIDLMVALSYPRVFTINRATGEGEFRPEERGGVGRRTGPVSVWDPWGYPSYGWGGYYPGYRRGYGWYGGRPVIVRESDDKDDDSRPRARAVKGRGYTRGGDGGSVGTNSSPRPSSSPAGASSGSSGSGSSSGSTRKAKPRGGGE